MTVRAGREPTPAAVAPSAAAASATALADVADLAAVAAQEPGDVLTRLGSRADGLSGAEAQERLRTAGPNAIRSHHAQPLAVLGRQLRSPLLLLLLAAATVSFFVGERSDAVIIGAIVTLSVALGFINEFQAERAVEALHAQLRHRTVVRRDGAWDSRDVTEIVPGDIVRLEAGAIVPADVRILDAAALECDESILTGESLPVEKHAAPVKAGTSLAELSSCAFMGTLVRAGEGEAVVVATGGATEFGRIALRLGERQEETEFQVGLRRFSTLLAVVAGVLTSSIFVINLILARPLIDALLFSLAIAVGITPQLLPAVVATSLATGSRRLARRKVLVKRLVCIEDLGDTEVLLTDKTGTLTEGRIAYRHSVDSDGRPADDGSVLLLGLLCNEASVEHGVAVGGNSLDIALWDAAGPVAAAVGDYRRVGVAPFDHDRRRTSVLVDGPTGRCLVTKGAPEGVLERSVGVPAAAQAALDAELAAGARVVAVASRRAPELAAVTPADEHDLTLAGFLVFLDPPKASAAAALDRLRRLGVTVKVVTGDHPTVALKVCRDLGLDAATALTGADLEKLDDAAVAARVRDPSQILLNNLLYDTSQLAIPTDRVDEEQLARPSHWNIAFIRRFMTFFGPISSLFDFLTFAVLLHVFKAGPALFRSGWFVESLATQTLVIFVIRTRRVPFFRSTPSRALAAAVVAAVLVGAALPMTPLAHDLGFAHLPAGYFAALVAMVVAYVALAEAAKREFYRHHERPREPFRGDAARRIHRRAARFSSAGGLGT